jgi:hypothetical protein
MGISRVLFDHLLWNISIIVLTNHLFTLDCAIIFNFGQFLTQKWSFSRRIIYLVVYFSIYSLIVLSLLPDTINYLIIKGNEDLLYMYSFARILGNFQLKIYDSFSLKLSTLPHIFSFKIALYSEDLVQLFKKHNQNLKI